MSERKRPEDKRGRVERALEADLLDHREVSPAERAALRAQARAVDVAEARADPDQVSRANVAYLDLRQAAGLTVGGQTKPVDGFDAFMAGLMGAGTGGSDPTPP